MDEGQPILVRRNGSVPTSRPAGSATPRSTATATATARGQRRVHPILLTAALGTAVLLCAVLLLDIKGYILHHHLPSHHDELVQLPGGTDRYTGDTPSLSPPAVAEEQEQDDHDDEYPYFGSFYGDFNDHDVDSAHFEAAVSWKSIANILGGFSTSFLTSPELNVSWVSRPAGFGPHVTDRRGYLGQLVRISGPPHDENNMKGCNVNLTAILLDKQEVEAEAEAEPEIAMQRDIQQNKDDDDASRSATGNPSGMRSDDEIQPAKDQPLPRFALVERGECPFIVKILNAQAAGFDGVVVYNDEAHRGRQQGENNGFGDQDELISMWSPSREAGRITIPSVFVGYATGKTLLELLQASESRSEPFRIVMEAEDPPHLFLMDVIIMLFFLPTFFTMFVIVCSRIRLLRQRAKLRAPRTLVENLPTFKWRENLEQDIEALEVGEKGGSGASSTARAAVPDKTTGAAAVEGTANSSAFSLRTIFNRSVFRNAPATSSPANETHPPSSNQEATGTAGAGDEVPLPIPPHKVRQLARKIFSQRECSICLADFAVGEEVKLLPCGHLFHREEIDNWLIKSRNWCPVCRCSIGGDEEEDEDDGIRETEYQGAAMQGAAEPDGSTDSALSHVSPSPSTRAAAATTARPIITRQDLVGIEDRDDDDRPVASSSTAHERTPLLPPRRG